MSYLLVCPDAQAAKPSAGTIHRWRFLCSLHSEGSRSHTGCQRERPPPLLTPVSQPPWATPSLWRPAFPDSRADLVRRLQSAVWLAGCLETDEKTSTPEPTLRKPPSYWSGLEIPTICHGHGASSAEKSSLSWLGGPSPGEDEVLSAYPGGVVRETLGHRRGGCLLAALRAGAGSWRCPGASGRVGPGSAAGDAGRALGQQSRECRQGAQAACRWVCRLVPGSAAVEGRGSPRELSVEGGLRSEARSRHGPGDAAGCGCCQCLLGAQGASVACSPRRW
ncbi:hypothetical protein NDU88_003693 [Pleurodeles waltl]|uniref:Uncharacterized protein n=1 Tax=Pleurodeles waltl TaxID=8319 RepID=A0AAV7WT12_PLEWA|nr:hypothetical protein NDU88_003693 [Pleurodeles waltl]